jgi:GNAT superfamily N-acetyltransferase
MNPVAASFQLREAAERDRPAVNAIYAALGFMPWDPKQDQLIVAVAGDRLVGCGRLQRYANAVELGGMYVHPNFRGQGIARQILKSLVDLLGGETCYCIPFDHLIPFYEQFGFVPGPRENLPQAVAEKVAYFRDVYMHPTILMVRN